MIKNENIYLLNLRKLIKNKFKFEKNFYEKLGVNKSTFISWHKGTLNPSIKKCFEMANILEIDYQIIIQAFFTDDVKKNKEIVCNKLLFGKKKKGE